jgi:hypothetical protein
LDIHVGGNVLTIENQFWADYHVGYSNPYRYEVETLSLDDGTVIDLTGGLTFTGTNDAEAMYGVGSRDDILIGLEGNDTLHGQVGDDTYIWSIGDGSDTIYESDGQDTLVLQDVLQSSISLETTDRHLYVDIGAERITIDNHFLDNGNDYRIETIEFSDGSQLDLGEYYNTAPMAEDDAFIGDQDATINGNVFDNNGSGTDSDDGTFNAVAGTYATTNGSVTLSEDGSFTYTPDAGYNGADSFVYTIEDEYGAADTATKKDITIPRKKMDLETDVSTDIFCLLR